jgi:hypothetical protein
MRRTLLVGLAIVLPVLRSEAQQTFTFEDVVSGTGLHAGYNGFDWTRFTVLNGANAGWGYANAVVSGVNVAFGSGEQYVSTSSSTTSFTLNSAFFTSAFKDGATMTVKGYSSPIAFPPGEDPNPYTVGSADYFTQFLIDTHGPLAVQFDWTDVYLVSFTSTGGTTIDPQLDPGANGYFAVDDITVNALVTPEPASATLLATGFVGMLGLAGRRRRISYHIVLRFAPTHSVPR